MTVRVERDCAHLYKVFRDDVLVAWIQGSGTGWWVNDTCLSSIHKTNAADGYEGPFTLLKEAKVYALEHYGKAEDV